MLTKAIQESSYIAISKWKTLRQPVYFLGDVEFSPTFDLQIGITLTIFWEKLKNCTL